MDAAIIENEHQDRVRKDLMELVEKRDKSSGITPVGAFPVKALGAAVEGAENRRSLAFGGRCLMMGLAFRRPAPLDVGLIGKVGFIFKQNLYGWGFKGLDFGDDLCHTLFFSAGEGA